MSRKIIFTSDRGLKGYVLLVVRLYMIWSSELLQGICERVGGYEGKRKRTNCL